MAFQRRHEKTKTAALLSSAGAFPFATSALFSRCDVCPLLPLATASAYLDRCHESVCAQGHTKEAPAQHEKLQNARADGPRPLGEEHA